MNDGKNKYLTYFLIVGLLIGVIAALITKYNVGICAGVGMMLGITVGAAVDYEKHGRSCDNRK